MPNVSYVKKYCKPSQSQKKLMFKKEEGEIISEDITLKLEIVLDEYAITPIETIRLTIAAENSSIYEIKGEGGELEINYENKSENFETAYITFQIKLLNPNQPLEKDVLLSVVIMDLEENISVPNDNSKFYEWRPIIELNQAKSPMEILS